MSKGLNDALGVKLDSDSAIRADKSIITKSAKL